MLINEIVENPSYHLRRVSGSGGRLVFSNVTHWYNKGVFRDISIKYCIKGTEYYYDSGHNEYKVKEGHFLLGVFEPNSGESIVESSSVVGGVCVYIKPELLSGIHAALTEKEEYDLDGFCDSNLKYPDFFNHIFEAKYSLLQEQINKVTSWFYNSEKEITDEMFDEFLIETSEKIVLLQYNIHQSLTRLEFLRRKTREEITRRLLNGKAYIDANYLSNPSLDEVSLFAGLSKYHFFRSFKLAYCQTPFEYTQEKRLEHARSALEKRDAGLKEIAMLCSFSDMASFSKAFKRKFGVPPSTMQKLTQPVYFFMEKK